MNSAHSFTEGMDVPKEESISFGAIEETKGFNKHNPNESDPEKYHYNNFPDGTPMTKQNIKSGQMWVAAGKNGEWVDVMDCDKSPMLLWWCVPREINGITIW